MARGRTIEGNIVVARRACRLAVIDRLSLRFFDYLKAMVADESGKARRSSPSEPGQTSRPLARTSSS